MKKLNMYVIVGIVCPDDGGEKNRRYTSAVLRFDDSTMNYFEERYGKVLKSESRLMFHPYSGDIRLIDNEWNQYENESVFSFNNKLANLKPENVESSFVYLMIKSWIFYIESISTKMSYIVKDS